MHSSLKATIKIQMRRNEEKLVSILKHIISQMVRFQLELIYLYFPPSSELVYVMFLSCRPFVVITTLSTGLVGVEVTSVKTKGLQDRNITYTSWDDGGK